MMLSLRGQRQRPGRADFEAGLRSSQLRSKASFAGSGSSYLHKAKIASLEEEIKYLRAALPESLSISTTAAPTVIVAGHSVQEEGYEEVILLAVIMFMLMLWMVPFLRPFRYCCETRLHKVYPAITLINLLIFAVTLNQLCRISFNDVFFAIVKLFDVFLDSIEQVLIGISALFAIGIVWKFKDRVFEVLGVENAAAVFGDFRDWATCWSMRRFHPMEIVIWKVEGLPSARLHSPNDVFCEVSFGYNVTMKTRVHHRAGHSCTFKEALQLNFDPFDAERRLTLCIKSQEVIGDIELAKLQMGAEQVREMEEPDDNYDRSLVRGSMPESAWSSGRFRCIDLVPAGKVYLRFIPVSEDSKGCWESLLRT
ncbi:unnamed protein product [Effrenium voratum]|nr:unnamed protein product [Effrenium voratum]